MVRLRGSLVLILALLALATLAGVAYAAYSYAVAVQGRVEVAVTVDPGLEASPTSIDFAGVVPGTRSPVRSLTITNKGNVTLTRLLYSVPGLPSTITFLESQVPANPGPVPPGGKWDVWVQMEVGAGTPAGIYTFTINFSAE